MTAEAPRLEQTQTIADVLREATTRLAAAGSPTPRLDAEVLLRHSLGLDRTGLFVKLREPLAAAERTRFEALLQRRLAGEPVAYVIGVREFMGLPFAVGHGVLVPRPETELLVEWALIWLQRRPTATVIDVGTGCGAIALSLAAHLDPSWRGRIVAADLSAEALCFAARNRQRLGLTDRVHLVRGDLLGWCRGPVDLILANLPYLRPDQLEGGPSLRAEPALALLGGTDGLELIQRLVIDAPRVVAPGGALGLEIDPSQSASVAALIRQVFPNAAVTVRRDLAGFDRHVTAELPEQHRP